MKQLRTRAVQVAALSMVSVFVAAATSAVLTSTDIVARLLLAEEYHMPPSGGSYTPPPSSYTPPSDSSYQNYGGSYGGSYSAGSYGGTSHSYSGGSYSQGGTSGGGSQDTGLYQSTDGKTPVQRCMDGCGTDEDCKKICTLIDTGGSAASAGTAASQPAGTAQSAAGGVASAQGGTASAAGGTYSMPGGGKTVTCCPPCDDPTGVRCSKAPCVIISASEKQPAGMECRTEGSAQTENGRRGGERTGGMMEGKHKDEKGHPYKDYKEYKDYGEFKDRKGKETYEDVYQSLFEKHKSTQKGFIPDEETFTKHLEERKYGAEELSRLKEVKTDLVTKYLQKTRSTKGVDLFQASAAADLKPEIIEQFLETKTEIAEKVDDIKKSKQLNAQQKENLDELQNYTFHKDVAQGAAALAEKITALPHQVFEKELEKLMQESHQKNEWKPFGDVDLFDQKQWYALAAAKMKELGVIKGINGEFKGEKETSREEFVVMCARALDLADTTGTKPTSAVGRGMPEWARGAAAGIDAKLGENGLNLDKIFEDKGSELTRKDVALLIATLLPEDLPAPDRAVLSDYKDLGGLPQHVQAAITQVAVAGIMKGPGDGTWNPKQKVIRAQSAEILHKVLGVVEANAQEDEDLLDEEKNDTEGTEEDLEKESAPTPAASAQETSKSASKAPEDTLKGDAAAAYLKLKLDEATPGELAVITSLVEAGMPKSFMDPNYIPRNDLLKNLRIVLEKANLAKVKNPLYTVNLLNQIFEPKQREELYEILEAVAKKKAASATAQ